jgi:hypothetical protein
VIIRVAWLLLLAACAEPGTAPTPVSAGYVVMPLRPTNCGTPDQLIACKQRGAKEPRIIWKPKPSYPITKEQLPDLTPPPDWP